jgi:hypothetical protein
MFRAYLHLVANTVPIQACGWARGADGVKHAFIGWLELVAVLGQAVSATRIDDPERRKEATMTNPGAGQAQQNYQRQVQQNSATSPAIPRTTHI